MEEAIQIYLDLPQMLCANHASRNGTFHLNKILATKLLQKPQALIVAAFLSCKGEVVGHSPHSLAVVYTIYLLIVARPRSLRYGCVQVIIPNRIILFSLFGYNMLVKVLFVP